MPSRLELDRIKNTVLREGQRNYRDLPWRNTTDPYAVWLSEAMLQQTQVTRVIDYWERWLEYFPTVDALAAADLTHVLELWKGLGYNRRALSLKKAASIISEEYAGIVPQSFDDLVALPGIGPATAGGIRVFGFRVPEVYFETNVRTVFLHELYPNETDVSDKQLMPAVETLALEADSPAEWNWALLDYGAYLKKVLPNPSRRSKHHTRQSKFEGSHRQKRSWVLQFVLSEELVSTDQVAVMLGENDVEHPVKKAQQLLEELTAEGFLSQDSENMWSIST